MMTGDTMRSPNGNQLWRAFVGGHFVKDVLLRGVPAGAAELLGPADADPALLCSARCQPIVLALEDGSL